MKKRVVSLLLCLIMALSLIPTAAFATEGVPDANNTPDVQAATDEVAVQGKGDNNKPTTNNKPQALGWKYATITSNRNGGYTCTPATKPTDATITVKVGDTELATAGNKYNWVWDNIDSNRSTPVTVTVSEGYYISAIVFCCNDTHYSYGEGFNCQTSKTEQAYKQGGKLTDSSVTMTLGELWDTTPHRRGNQASPYNQCYWLMIMVAKCPDPVFVGYDVGTADGVDFTGIAPVEKSTPTDKGKWIDGTYNMRYENFDNDTPEHTALGISAAAAKKAAEKGYVFDGWSVVRYDEYDQVNNTFNKASTTDSAHANAKDSVTLFTHTKLVAQWKEAPKPTTGSLTIEKKVEGLPDTAVPTSFTITVKGDDYDQTETVKNGASVTFDGLTIGKTYTITEANANVDGYIWTTAFTLGTSALTGGNLTFNGDTTVTVTNTYTQKATVTNTVPASLTIKKVASDTKEVLADAKFVLRKGTDTLPLTYNAEKGIYEVSITADGTWSLYETEAPFGYKDVPATGKQVATVIVTAKDSAPVFDAKRDNWVITKTYTIDNVTNGTVALAKVEGAYQIENTKDFGKDVTIPAEITIKKFDENGNPLAGAEFALSFGTAKTLISKDNGDGTYTISGIDTVGAWTLSETKAPERHQKTDKTWTVNVTKALEVTQDPDTGVYQNVYTYSADSVTFEVINNRWYADEVINPATLTIYKSDSKVATKMLEGAKFTLTQGTTVLESEDKGNGVYTISGINNIGNWTLTETTAPQGYVLPTEGWTINVSKSLTFNEVEIDDNGVKKYQKVYTYETNQPDDTMFIKNSAMGALTISKELKGDLVATDFDKPFSFTVLRDTTEIETFGLLTGHSHSLQLAPGRYTIVENNANVDGYKLTTSFAPNYIVEVKAGEEITVVATNTYEKITGTVTINKVLKGLNATDFEDSFAFDIKDASGKVVATVDKVFPNAAQPATVTLAPGKYTIVEKSADVKDYDLVTEYDKQTFTVEADKNVTVTVTNTYTKKVTPPPAEYTLSVDIQKNIELKRSSSRKPGKASFTFEAYLVDGNGKETILDTVTIDTKGTKSADGKLTFTLTDNDLSVTGHGTVYVREVKGDTRGWTYDDTVYALGVGLTPDGKLNIISMDKQRVDKPVTLEFTNVYYKRSTTTGGDDKPVPSPKTGDMGIAMYAMTSLLSLGGAALVIKKRKEEK